MKIVYKSFIFVLVLTLMGGSCSDVTTNVNEAGVVRTPSPPTSPVPLRTPDRVRYESENNGFYGLYYLKSSDDSDERKLIISEDDKPIQQKPNDPGEATNPGFYLSHENRLDFEEIDVKGTTLFFKTRESNGSYFEFRGVFAEIIDPDFSEDVPIPVINGQLRTFKNGKLVGTENVEFGHAIVM